MTTERIATENTETPGATLTSENSVSSVAKKNAQWTHRRAH